MVQLLEDTVDNKYAHCEDAIEHGHARTVTGGTIDLGGESAAFPEQHGVRDGGAATVLYD